MRITVAITAASGAIYAKELLDRLSHNKQVERINLILSQNALSVVAAEVGSQWLEQLPPKVRTLQNDNFYCSIASGSNCDDVMVIVPCSAATLGRVAHGVSDTLITRAADVALKERKKLILVLRETPYSLIHIENMKLVTLSGGIILPATPSFYQGEISVESIIKSVVERIEQHIGLSVDKFRWQED